MEGLFNYDEESQSIYSKSGEKISQPGFSLSYENAGYMLQIIGDYSKFPKSKFSYDFSHFENLEHVAEILNAMANNPASIPYYELVRIIKSEDDQL